MLLLTMQKKHTIRRPTNSELALSLHAPGGEESAPMTVHIVIMTNVQVVKKLMHSAVRNLAVRFRLMQSRYSVIIMRVRSEGFVNTGRSVRMHAGGPRKVHIGHTVTVALWLSPGTRISRIVYHVTPP